MKKLNCYKTVTVTIFNIKNIQHYEKKVIDLIISFTCILIM